MAKESHTTDEELKGLLKRLIALVEATGNVPYKTTKEKTPFLCGIQSLPQGKWEEAAKIAIKTNPVNRPSTQLLNLPGVMAPAFSPSAEFLAVLTSKYWGSGGVHLTVGFLEETNKDLRNMVLAHMNAWQAYANVEFVYTKTDPKVRITFGPGGYKSYLGTDILLADPNEPTMWLDGFTINTPESEFCRVVRHETGHTLGFPHEHTRKEIVDQIDREKAIVYFMRTQGWSREDVISQVLTPLEQSAIMSTEHADQNSVMCYSLPGIIMKNNMDVPGGSDINSQDATFASVVYPKINAALSMGRTTFY